MTNKIKKDKKYGFSKTSDRDKKIKNGIRKPRLSLVPGVALIYESLAMEHGADKYGQYNWRDPTAVVSLMIMIDAMERHMQAIKDGEWFDEESGLPHLAHIRAGAGIVLDAKSIGTLLDDLPLPGQAAELLKQKTIKPKENE